MAISQDNKLILTASVDSTLCVWQFSAADKPLCQIYIHVIPSSIAISKDKKTIIATGGRKHEPIKMLVFHLITKPISIK